MKKLGLLLIVVGVLAGPLLTVRAMVVDKTGIESGASEAAVADGVRQAMTGSTIDLAVSQVGVVIVLVSHYRSRSRV